MKRKMSRSRSVSRGRTKQRTSSTLRSKTRSKARSMSISSFGAASSTKSEAIGNTTFQQDNSTSYLRKKQKRTKPNFQKKVRYALQNELGDQVLTRQLLGTAISVAGKQSVVDYSMWGFGDIGVFNHDDLTQCYRGYNQNVGAPNQYIISQSCNFDFTVSNIAEYPVLLKVLYCYAKTDTSQTPREVWDDMDQQMTFLPNHTYLEGAIGKPDYNTPQTLPFTSPAFCRKFTITKVKNYYMQQAATVCWRDTDSRRIKHLNSDYGSAKYKKGTRFIMLIHYGIDNKDPMIPFSTKATAYPEAGINVFISKTYKFNALKDSYNTCSFSDNVS